MTAMPLSPSKKEGGNQTHHSSPKKTLSKPPRHPMLVESGSPPGPPPVTTASSHKHHAVQDSLASLEELFLSKEDRAEQGLLKSMEQRRSFVSESNTKEWRPATPGERPPLVGTTMEPSTTLLAMESGVAHARRASELSQQTNGSKAGGGSVAGGGGGGSVGSQSSAGKLSAIARRMRMMSSGSIEVTSVEGGPVGGGAANSATSSLTGRSTNSHRRAPTTTRAQTLLDSIQEESNTVTNIIGQNNNNSDNQSSSSQGNNNNTGSSSNNNEVFGGVGTTPSTITNNNDTTTTIATNNTTMELDQAVTSTDRLLTGAMAVEDLFDDSPPTTYPGEEDEDELVGAGFDDNEEDSGERTPLTKRGSLSYQHGSINDSQRSRRSSFHNNNPNNNNNSNMSSPYSKAMRQKAAKKKRSKHSMFYHCCQRLGWMCCHPFDLIKQLLQIVWYQSYISTLALPAFVLAAILFYGLENPQWTFLPGHASVAWWLNFLGRQVVLLEVSRVIQWCCIDKLVLGTRLAVQCLGPLLTLCCIQARGWPFCLAVWGFLALLVIDGTSEFERHWFYFLTPVSMYSEGGDTGSYILSSDLYTRLLLSMILAGVVTALKRTAVAMYFGRRTFVEFKPRLEKLLKEVILVSELAALAEEAEIAAMEEQAEQEFLMMRSSGPVLVPRGGGGVNPHVAVGRGNKVKFLGDDVTWNSNKKKNSRGAQNDDGVPSKVPAASSSGENSDSDDESEVTTPHDIRPEAEGLGLSKNSSGSLRFKDMLEHWEEPVNKADKSLNASISDILKFRRALFFLDDDHPFGELFGKASTRDQVIASAHDVYQRLLKLTPGKAKVSCEFYDMLALEDDGENVNYGKRKALRKLFRPDANNELSLLAFVQCCDGLYKKLRYFRANVGNSSVIDHALESMLDGAFSFVLGLIVLTVMKINPWPLLVSCSTLLVSISFAVGNSASKWFEGMLLVALRRPFDLGDRIYMMDPSAIDNDGLFHCWFVEDINLFHTTVRYAGTNEVATINNGSVANMRIVNGQRSPNAVVWFQFPFRPTLIQEPGMMDKIKAALEGYARDHPRDWHSYSYFRVDDVFPDQEKLVVTIGMQHRSSWQDLAGILEAKAAIRCWLMEYCHKLGVLYDELPKRQVMYYGGALKDGRAGPTAAAAAAAADGTAHGDTHPRRRQRFDLHDPANIQNGGFPVVTTPPPPPSASPIESTSEPSAAAAAAGKPNPPPMGGFSQLASYDSTFLEHLQQSHG